MASSWSFPFRLSDQNFVTFHASAMRAMYSKPSVSYYVVILHFVNNIRYVDPQHGEKQ